MQVNKQLQYTGGVFWTQKNQGAGRERTEPSASEDSGEQAGGGSCRVAHLCLRVLDGALAVDHRNLKLGRRGFGQSTEAALCRAP